MPANGESGLRLDPLRAVAGHDKGLRSGVHADTEGLEQLRGDRLDQAADHLRQLFGLDVQVLSPLGECPQGVPKRVLGSFQTARR
ncbi:hypothetical protein [Streptomyces sp. NPDC059861]|uniref:hypothetical protein n=1 Tax=Streptomyces sp. NPDC059861 TaxID=3346974 RepID=UPI0036678616